MNNGLPSDLAAIRLSDAAKQIWEEFWMLSPEDRDLLLCRILRRVPLTVVVGGQGHGNVGDGEVKVYPRHDLTAILGDILERQAQ